MINYVVGVTFSTSQRMVLGMAAAVKARVKFKKLVEEDKSLETRTKRRLRAINSIEVRKGREEKSCKKSKSLFNSVAAVLIAISVLVLSLLVSLVVALIVKEPLSLFYISRFQWRLDLSKTSSLRGRCCLSV